MPPIQKGHSKRHIDEAAEYPEYNAAAEDYEVEEDPGHESGEDGEDQPPAFQADLEPSLNQDPNRAPHSDWDDSNTRLKAGVEVATATPLSTSTSSLASTLSPTTTSAQSSLFPALLVSVVIVSLALGLYLLAVKIGLLPQLFHTTAFSSPKFYNRILDSDDEHVAIQQKVKLPHEAIMGDELNVNAGEFVEVLQEEGEFLEPGWYLVRKVRTGEMGHIPMNCLTGVQQVFAVQ
ncbi:hypothetical protein BC830DRAFT_858921 [Chytriomyces sp. MP71]|nr:hypothetical protein BC830DRAFT_858921 [Chytriomyces sp. MP71]